jgi:hypothetical protein
LAERRSSRPNPRLCVESSTIFQRFNPESPAWDPAAHELD